jgi:hypothetical protein
MHQIVYISTARPGITETDVDAILAKSRANNRRDGITGLLISDGTRFLQALEGDQPLVEAAYHRIKADARHRAAVILSGKSVERRQFGTWDMAFGGFGRVRDEAALAAAVDRLVAEVKDPNTRALFSGFARISRKNAA